ncbi:hypothetical protein [Streptomyces lydicus]|uniref:hypothetical protein n=1 Tax=Streptomyces lydicus TaxID=47763 RepID=UPI003721A2F8
MTDNVTLAAGAVSFITANENRDWDTGINLSLATPDAVEVASLSVPFGEFKDGMTSGPYPLAVLTGIEKSDVENGTATVTIHPNGDDTWRFDMRLRLRFSDDTHIFVSITNVELSDDRNSSQFALGSATR